MRNFLFLLMALTYTIVTVGQCPTFSITITNQDQVDSFPSDYPDCINHPGKIEIQSSTGDLQNVDSLIQLKSCQALIIINNQNLESIKGLSNLESLYQLEEHTGSLVIRDNPSLKSLEGLENITKVKTSFTIRNCPLVEDLRPLRNIVAYEDIQTVMIIQGTGITSLSGIGQIDIPTEDQKYLNVSGNSNLTICNVQSACDYVSNPPSGPVTFYDNSTGCNSYEEVLESCDVLSTAKLSLDNTTKVYPNPASEYLSVETLEESTLRLRDMSGRLIRHESNLRKFHTVDIADVKSGIYVLELIVDDKPRYHKVVVE